MGEVSDFVRGVVSVLLKNGVLHNEPCEIRQNLIRKKCCTCYYMLNQCFNSVLEKKGKCLLCYVLDVYKGSWKFKPEQKGPELVLLEHQGTQ